jgi:hypothetical protein
MTPNKENNMTRNPVAAPDVQTGIEVQLIGADGNVFNLIGKCMKALRGSDLSSSEQVRISEAFMAEVADGDYNHALQTMTRYFEVS